MKAKKVETRKQLKKQRGFRKSLRVGEQFKTEKMKNYLILATMLLTFGLVSAQSTTLQGNNGKWTWDGKYVTNYNNSSDKWEWDGKYIKSYNNSSIKWEWDGKYLKNYSNSSDKWEWDGKYLKNYSNSSIKYEIPAGAPVPVWAVVLGIIR